MHLLANGLTCIPQAAWLDPELRRMLPTIERMALALEDGGYDYDSIIGVAGWFKALAWLNGHRVKDTNAYAIPFLSPEYCDLLIEESRRFNYTPNDDEDSEYQIPEFVLQHECPQLATCMQCLFEQVIVPISKVVYGPNDLQLTSAQFAQYTPHGTAHGNWHLDDDSDVTAVVSLAPELFTGGGTDIRVGPVRKVHVPKLNKGSALLFHGKTTLHRGTAVESGVRDLLVFWSMFK